MSDGAIRGFIDEAALVLSPLLDVESPDDVVRLLAKLGWTVASVPAPIADLTTAGADLLAALDGGDDATTTEELLAAIAKIVDAIEAIRARPDNAFPGTVDVASFKATIGATCSTCVVEYLLRYRVRIGRVLKVVGIVQVVNAPGVGRRQLRATARRLEPDRHAAHRSLRGVRESYDWTTGTPRSGNWSARAACSKASAAVDHVRPRARPGVPQRGARRRCYRKPASASSSIRGSALGAAWPDSTSSFARRPPREAPRSRCCLSSTLRRPPRSSTTTPCRSRSSPMPTLRRASR
jgi:hypothetical protein